MLIEDGAFFDEDDFFDDVTIIPEEEEEEEEEVCSEYEEFSNNIDGDPEEFAEGFWRERKQNWDAEDAIFPESL